MAVHALVLNHGSDRLRVGDFGGRQSGSRGKFDEAAHHILLGDGDRLVSQHRVKRILSPSMIGLRLLALISNAVVEGSSIHDFPRLRVDHDGLSAAGDTQLLADQLIRVHQDGQVVAVALCFGDDVFALVGRSGVQHHELDAFGSVFVLQRFDR